MIRMLLILTVICVATSSALANDVCRNYYTELKEIVEHMGWKVTSAMGGGHNAHSLHYIGKAIDVSVRGKGEFDILMLYTIMENQGYRVRDERKRPKGQKVWGGPHIHLSIPFCR